MAPQVGLEPHPEIPTAETIVLKFLKNTSKTSADAGFDDVTDLPPQTDRMSTSLGTPMVIPYLFLPIGFGLLGLQYALLFKTRKEKGEALPEAEKPAEEKSEVGQQI